MCDHSLRKHSIVGSAASRHLNVVRFEGPGVLNEMATRTRSSRFAEPKHPLSLSTSTIIEFLIDALENTMGKRLNVMH